MKPLASRQAFSTASSTRTITNLGFSQVFYPTRGILAWYDRKERKLKTAAGADDPGSCRPAPSGRRMENI